MKGSGHGVSLWGAILVLLLVISGCASKPPSRYQQDQDSEPHTNQDLMQVPDAVPRVEPRSKWGNKSPYQVLGKQYWVMPGSEGYEATGRASWYGTKFHGHTTSNGEIYNMYEMTAAHKSLPIPSYVRVTNLQNARKVIVRVNDRGPFHGDRVIDLSYAAATKLGYAKQGTANVRIEVIDPLTFTNTSAVAVNNPGFQRVATVPAPAPALSAKAIAAEAIYLQVGAFASGDSAQQLKETLEGITNEMVVVFLDQQRAPGLHKVHVGPLENMQSAERVRQLVEQQGFDATMIVRL